MMQSNKTSSFGGLGSGGMLPPKWPKWEKVGSPWGVDESGANDESSADLTTDLTTNDDSFFMGKPKRRCLMSEW